jgi:nitrous oxide reductase accessory protein NosL
MRERAGILSAVVAACAVIALAGCGRNAGPPPIARGAECAACGMRIEDLRFACERPAEGGWRAYDSIECLIRDARGALEGAVLADYDSESLHAADSLWVVRGDFPSPMGGGLAAFLDRAAADEIAARAAGRVDRLGAIAGGATP